MTVLHSSCYEVFCSVMFEISVDVIVSQDMPSQQVAVMLPALYVTVTLSRALPSVQVLPDVRLILTDIVRLILTDIFIFYYVIIGAQFVYRRLYSN